MSPYELKNELKKYGNMCMHLRMDSDKKCYSAAGFV